MTPQIGDIWLWCDKEYLLVLDYDPYEKDYTCLQLEDGKISNWLMETDNIDEQDVWEFVS